MSQIEISLRKGLPDYLRKLSKHYPREVWEKHSNFNDLTQFWLSRHVMFRELIKRLQQDSETIIDNASIIEGQLTYKKTLSRLTGFMLSQLHEHHNIEDHHYFPMLMPFDTDLQKGFDMLESDHQQLDKNIHNLAKITNELLTSLQTNQNIHQSVENLLIAQKKFEIFLDRHLSDEEELVVPIILEYGGPEI
ncbi:MAG: hemerythrin domain-containing protein [Hyphomicrobiales bacterium]|nr:hemerythrin domain-containing protein [Hyphomicrobiales bacterium]